MEIKEIKDPRTTASKQANGDLNPTTPNNWIWPTTWMSVEAYILRTPREEYNPANIWNSAYETSSRELAELRHTVPTSDRTMRL